MSTELGYGTGLGQVLTARAERLPDRVAFRSLRADMSEHRSVTYGELERRSRQIAGAITARRRAEGRVLLLTPDPIDYLVGLFGALHAGLTAVTGLPPYAVRRGSPGSRHSSRLERARSIIRDAGVTVAVGNGQLLSSLRSALANDWANIDIVDPSEDWPIDNGFTPRNDSARMALLQYTSGSTGSPRGVSLTHANLLANLACQQGAFDLSEHDVGVSWLPLHHDLGLIGACLAPMFVGFPSILMPAAGFLEQPSRWLSVISKYRGTISWAPNFAYKMCARMDPDCDPAAEFDLRSWRIAMNAAEPVSATTIREFLHRFASAGFDASAIYPSYGLAEATLAVSAPVPGQGHHVLKVDKQQLGLGRAVPATSESKAGAVELVACGRACPGVEIEIVSPERRLRCGEGEIGEIWVASDGVAEGYHGNPSATAETFQGTVRGQQKQYLRTGDLGFTCDGELYISGRLKDIIIFRGVNIYPQDLEETCDAAHPGIRSSCSCAFSVPAGDGEHLVLVCEIDRRFEAEGAEIAAAVRQAIFEQHDLQTQVVVLIRLATLAKTPSGKVQRRATRLAYERGELQASHVDVAAPTQVVPAGRPVLRQDAPMTRRDTEIWLRQQLPVERASSGHFADLGITSMQVTELTGKIEACFGIQLLVAEMFDLGTIRSVADQIHQQVVAQRRRHTTQVGLSGGAVLPSA